MILTPFYSNDSTAQVTHFSSSLNFRLDILTTDYFFTSFYLIMLLQNYPLFAQSGPRHVRSNSPYTIPHLPLVLLGS